MSESRILVLIPAYNEAKRLGAVVKEARVFLPVLVVDDGSKDDTAIAAQTAGADVLKQVPNQGKGAALKAGFRKALADGYDAVLTLDADGQHDPLEIPAFLKAHAARGADLIIGARDFSAMPFSRRVANTVGRGVFSWAMSRRIADNQSGYRLISRRLVEAVLASPQSGFEFEVEMIVIAAELGYAIDWVPIRTIYAGEGSHIQAGKHIRKFFEVAFETCKRMRRARG